MGFGAILPGGAAEKRESRSLGPPAGALNAEKGINRAQNGSIERLPIGLS
jgi:hypothetical protein